MLIVQQAGGKETRRIMSVKVGYDCNKIEPPLSIEENATGLSDPVYVDAQVQQVVRCPDRR